MADRVVVEFDFVEAMGTLAALRAVIDSAAVRPDKLVAAEQKLAAATRKGRGLGLCPFCGEACTAGGRQ